MLPHWLARQSKPDQPNSFSNVHFLHLNKLAYYGVIGYRKRT
jgi:hypothetical protein